ncbi:DUF2167 domain-containing protein [Pseudomonas sp.]|uniref:DUF2167 domain-containing protein n=1 Tax=Pseudomonas sp. TaxID=306 RepID=UPI00273421C1|nr:DUF2167 domain-containing protein [Pseudomonas sp.]MDP3816376.1 DUF2167 domain-containing protein [Pseudomonas sp.]
MPIKELILAALLAAALPVAWANAPVAEGEPAASEVAATEPLSEEAVEPAAEEINEEEFLATLNFQQGKVVLGDNLATLNLPEQLVFLNGEEAERVLVDAWGNPPDSELPLGMILPAGVSPFSDESWAVTVEYEENGYVSDEDAADIDYAEMLEGLKEEAQENNAWRAENGYEPVELIGWAAAPHYDAQGKKLYWAKELKFGESDKVLNYNIRVLGRKGVLVLNFIAGMNQLAEIEQHVPGVLAMTEFNEGSRYADFDPDLDEVAAYGIGALIAGKLAAKVGILAGALLLLKKLWIVPVLFFGWLFRRITGKRKAESQAMAAVEPVAEPPVQPAASTLLDMNKHEEDKR